MVVVNVNQILIDYVVVCDELARVLDFSDFVPLWKVANEIAEERVGDEIRAGERVEPVNN